MENLSWMQLILTFLGGGAVTGAISIFNAVSASRKELREAERLEKAANQTETTENRKLTIAEDERNQQETWRIIQDLRTELIDCKERYKTLEEGHSLSRPTLLIMFGAMNELRKALIKWETMFLRAAAIEQLEAQFAVVREKFDALDKVLPM